MNRTLLVFVVCSFLFSLTACAASTETAAANTPTSLSLEGQLLVGTLKLETTDLAVSSEQASQLLPLWKTLQSLASSGTAAPAEVEAVVNQIKAGMTSLQLSSITAMNLSRQDLLTAMAGMADSTTDSTASTSAGGNMPAIPSAGGSAAPAGGNTAGGNPPSDMGAGPMGASNTTGSTNSSQPAATQSAGSQSSDAADQISPVFIQAVVKLLKARLS